MEHTLSLLVVLTLQTIDTIRRSGMHCAIMLTTSSVGLSTTLASS